VPESATLHLPRRTRARRARRFVLVGILAVSAPAFATDPHAIALPTLPSLPTTTLTLPTLPTTTLTLPSLPTTTLTLPSLPTTLLTLPTTTLTLPTLPTTTLTLPTITTSTRPSPVTTTTSPVTASCGTLDCDDGNPCTADRCDPGVGCVHTPTTGSACDDGDACTAGDRCFAGLCAGTRLGCTSSLPSRCTCPDDGFACTDDVCTAAGCVHVPVDSRCVPAGACRVAVCAPSDAGADRAGCIVGPPQPDGARCAEDTDACTLDVCRGGVCAHVRVADTANCAPLQGALRQTLALEAVTQQIAAVVTAAAPGAADIFLPRLTTIEASLAAAARALAGDEQTGLATLVVAPAVESAIPASQRARIAFTEILRTPREVAAFLQDVHAAQQRAAITRAAGKTLRPVGRRLLVGTKALRRDLKKLQHGAVRTRRNRGHRQRLPRATVTR